MRRTDREVILPFPARERPPSKSELTLYVPRPGYYRLTSEMVEASGERVMQITLTPSSSPGSSARLSPRARHPQAGHLASPVARRRPQGPA